MEIPEGPYNCYSIHLHLFQPFILFLLDPVSSVKKSQPTILENPEH